MGLKAYAVSCDRLFPGTTIHYAAYSAHAAVNEAIISMAKIGNIANRLEVQCRRVPELDHLATSMNNQGHLELSQEAAI